MVVKQNTEWTNFKIIDEEEYSLKKNMLEFAKIVFATTIPKYDDTKHTFPILFIEQSCHSLKKMLYISLIY